MDNLILDTDSYKASHFKQYPPGTDGLFAYLESRGGKYPETVFFGLQYILERYLKHCPTLKDVEEANTFFLTHGEPFPYEQWKKVAIRGYIPLRIRAVPEGSVIPTGNVLMTVESTDPEAFWMVTWLETLLMRIWYPITVATQSREIKKLIYSYLQMTAEDPDGEILFKLHDFGSRGVSSRESAEIGGAAHLVNFMGSDTVAGVVCANKYYSEPMAGYSIPAAEHSTITTWGQAGETDAFANMLEQFGGKGPLLAVVSDSYDLYNAVRNIWGDKLKQKVLDCGSTVVIRPDSGDPTEMVLKTVIALDNAFGYTLNKKGYKVLNNVRVIQGDGINQESIHEILKALINASYSATNVAFGMGGALLQQINRDTQRFAYKTSAVQINGQWQDVRKMPVTDPGKWSKAGRLHLVRNKAGQYLTVAESRSIKEPDLLRTVFDDGTLYLQTDLKAIRESAKLV